MTDSLNVGDVITVDAAVFHRSGVDGACHIEEDIDYVAMEKEDTDVILVLTKEQEERLDSSIAGVLYSITVSIENGTKCIEKHPQVYSLKKIKNS